MWQSTAVIKIHDTLKFLRAVADVSVVTDITEVKLFKHYRSVNVTKLSKGKNKCYTNTVTNKILLRVLVFANWSEAL
uniref:Uncharacterized protein n=1 Tax=Amphimedon queenslandica TaxID=400682 RepID=A0A1X7TR16_AMPQE